MKNKVSILFVCHENICRSPMAEFIMKDLVQKAGLAENFRMESAAVSDEEIGSPVYPPAKRKLAEIGISCAGKFARKMLKSDYENFDFLIGMDADNISRMKKICGGDPKGKMRLLKSFSGEPNGEVADPWYTGDFSETLSDISAACKALLSQTSKNFE